MSEAGRLRDKLTDLVQMQPFTDRELYLLDIIIFSCDVDWDNELKTDSDWWGDDVCKLVKMVIGDD